MFQLDDDEGPDWAFDIIRDAVQSDEPEPPKETRGATITMLYGKDKDSQKWYDDGEGRIWCKSGGARLP